MKQSLLFILSLLIFSSCEKDSPALVLNGTYSGTFTLSNNDPLANSQNITTSTYITVKGDEYYSPSGNILKGGQGKFTVNSGVITFRDTLLRPAIGDGNLILTGDYNYEIKADSLFLSKKSGYNSYSYRLGKAN